MAHPKTFQILHISDLHINDSKEDRFDRSVVLDPLIERVKGDQSDVFRPEIVIVTGDIAFKGIKTEYDLAKDFFDDLLAALDLNSDRLFVVPGNHDVNRKIYRPKDVPQYDNMQELNTELQDQDYREDLLRGMADYFDFTETYLPHFERIQGRLVPFVNTYTTECHKKIGLVGLNSAWMCRKSTDERTIAIGEYQVKTAMEELKGKEEVDLQIVLFHHPLDWLWPIDRKICRTHLNNSILLSGHLHEVSGGYLSDLDGNLYRFQAGGAYLGTESSWPSRFHYITFDWGAHNIRLDFRKFVKERRKWSIDGETGDDGRKVFEMIGTIKEESHYRKAMPEIPETYSGWIMDHCTYMDVDHLQLDGKPIRIELPEIFIPLFAYGPGRESGDEDPQVRKETPLNVEELIGKHECLLIEGDAGSGKTTVLKHLAYCLADGECQGINMSGLEGCLPVLIFLKDLKGLFDGNGEMKDGVMTVEVILSHYFKSQENVLDFETVKDFCNAERAVFLLDGLDEMAPEHRANLVNAFANFKNRYKGNKIVFSGRSHGVVGAAMDKFGRNHVKILPLTMEQVETYVKKWFQYIYSESSALGGKTADAMISEIREHHAIEELIENPLMLTATCILYHGGKELPGQRAELYKKFVNNLLHRRFKEPEKICEFLINLAYGMHQMGVRGADKVFAIEKLKVVYKQQDREMETEYRKRIENLFEDIEPKCGLLKFERGQYNFRHLTFQEFLAAVYIVDNHTDYGGAIEDYWDNERYKEVIELYIGYLSIDNKRWANRIVQDVLNNKDAEGFPRWRLAARSLLDMQKDRREIDVLDLATERLRKVIECGAGPEDLPVYLVDVGETLGWLGDCRALDKFVSVRGGVYNLESGRVEIEPFEMAKYPITNQWFVKFIRDDGYKRPEYWSGQGKRWLNHTRAEHPRFWGERKWNCPNSPVVGVCWYEADAFARWLTMVRADEYVYRLPDGNQWEAVAAGLEKRKYPWGNDWHDGKCNTGESNIGGISPVGIFTKGDTPEGISDLAGNVWEWTKTDFHSNRGLTDFRFDDDMQRLFDDKNWDQFFSKQKEKDRQLPELRGGSWNDAHFFARCASRFRYNPGSRYFKVGFRCVRTKK